MAKNTILSVTMAAGVLLGCGEKKETPAPAPDKTAATSAPAPKAKKAAKEIFVGAKPTLPGPASALAFGMPIEEARKAAPDLFKTEYGTDLADYTGVKISIDLDADKTHVRDIRVGLKDSFDDAKVYLTAVWGAPKIGGSAEYPNLLWDNPDKNVRAYLEKSVHQVVYTPVVSEAQFFGDTAGRFGFEKTVLVGASEADVRTSVPSLTVTKDDPPRYFAVLPPIENSEGEPSVSFTFKDGKVTQWTLQLGYSLDKTAKDRMLAALEKKFGKPASSNPPYLDYPGPPVVKADPSGADSIYLWIGTK